MIVQIQECVYIMGIKFNGYSKRTDAERPHPA